MHALNKKLVDKTYDRMYAFSFDALEDSTKYTMKNLSVFDHLLTNEEAEKKVLFFENALEKGDSLETKEYFKNHDKFLDFYLQLYDHYKIYAYLIAGYGPDALVEFDSIEEYKSHVLLSVREQLFLKIIIPELFIVMHGGFDLTHQIYVVKGKEEYLGKLEPLIKRSGLHIL